MSEKGFIESNTPAAGTTESGKAFNVYRLRENPTWVKFGLHAARAGPVQPSASVSYDVPRRLPTPTYWDVSATRDRGGDLERRSCGRDAHSTFSSPYCSSSTASPSSAMRFDSHTTLADTAADAALRYERQRLQQRNVPCSSRMSASLHSTADTTKVIKQSASSAGVSVTSCPAAHSATTPSERQALQERRIAETPSCHSNGGNTHASTLARRAAAGSILRDRTNLANEQCVKETSTVLGTSHDSAGVHQSCTPVSASVARSFVSRAAVTHLSGCAAVVDVEGPLDSLYIPLRRPPPRSCAATRQHFSIFGDVADLARTGGGDGKESASKRPLSAHMRIDPVYHAPGNNAVGVHDRAPSKGDAYQTSSSAYGRGF
jgi:hypothetical protein